MSESNAFLREILRRPEDATTRLVYADWLDERGDPRAAFLRLHVALRSLPPDHPHRRGSEEELSRLRKGLDISWLAVVEPERGHLYANPPVRPSCGCLRTGDGGQRDPDFGLHREPQDTECDAWKRLLVAIETAAADGRDVFAPWLEVRGAREAEHDPDEVSPWLERARADYSRIVTLPPTIGKLKKVRRLELYGSHLVRIPPEIGQMTALEDFDPYTSYRLHWLPYEITRCPNLRDSRVSTRALYGNYKYRPPFPRLEPPAASDGAPWDSGAPPVRNCSVCDRPFEDRQLHRVWISLWVATDVLPLLVNACSEDCIRSLPATPDNYVKGPHRGGPGVQQPPRQ
jgi:uncharacterized protein (TIGR02996 family)